MDIPRIARFMSPQVGTNFGLVNVRARLSEQFEVTLPTKMLRNFQGLLIAILLLVGCLLGSGCASSRTTAQLHRYDFKQPHMGTLFTMTLYAADSATARTASDAAFAKVEALENVMSDYDPESELMKLCGRPVGEPVPISEELFDILQKSQCMAELSDGAFDVTVGPLIRLWRRTRRSGALPAPEAIAKARESVGWKKLKLDPATQTATLTVSGMQLDVGGIGKGYAASKALGVLKQNGVTAALVAASGDIAVGDAPPGERGWRVGVGMLDGKTNEMARVLLLENQAISTSGDTEQFVEIDGKRYSHIVDPRTGIGVTERLQVSVVARHGEDSDSCDTAISVLGVERGLKLVNSLPNRAALIIRKEGAGARIIESRRWKNLRFAPTAK